MNKLLYIIVFLLATIDLSSQLINIPLVAHWTFDDKNTEDISGNEYHGTPVNTVDYAPGFDGIGFAARLYGREFKIAEDGNMSLIGSHILLPKINFDSLGDFSVTMWVKENELYLWEGESYIFWGDYSQGWLGMGVFPLLDGTGNPTLYSTYAVGARQNYIDDIPPYRDFFDYDLKYKWVFYALIYENGRISAYRNRELLGTYDQQINIFGDFAAIGCHKMAGDSLSARLSMDVDDIRIYHGILQEDDLKVLQQFCNNSGKIADWSFDEEADDEKIVYDLSGNELDSEISDAFARDIGVKNEGRSVEFFGPFVNTPAGYMKLPFVNFYHFDEFSISIWIREKDFEMLPFASYLFYGDWNDGWLGVIRKRENEDDPKSPSKVYFSVGGNQVQKTISSDYDKYWGNIWTNYVMTYKDGILRAYINGKYIGEITTNININGVNGFSGLIMDNDSQVQKGRFAGHIDNFQIFCYELQEDEIAKIYQPCDETQFNFNDFSPDDDHLLGIIGNAYIGNGRLRLSETVYEKSAVWYGQKVPVRDGFETEFIFRISNGADLGHNDGSEPGGDGFAFVIYNGGTYEIGEDGKGKANGYKGLTNSIAVEFDLYKNDPLQDFDYNDPNGNHIAIQTGRSGPNSAVHSPESTIYITENIPLIKSDGSQIYHARIDYNVEPGRFRVFLDTDGNFTEPVIDLENFDIQSFIDLEDGSRTFLGFTASTSEVSQIHDILSWSACPFFTFCEDFNDEIITDQTTPICEGDSVLLTLNQRYSMYEWSDGSYNEFLTVTKTGDFSVKAYDANGCNDVFNIHIDVLPFPQPQINEGAETTEICEGESIILRTKEKYSSYQWSSGEISDTIIVSEGGKYSVIVSNEAGCQGEDEINVNVIELPESTLTIFGNDLLCKGDTLLIEAPKGASSYVWYKENINNTIGSNDHIFVTESGKYYVEMLFGEKCPLQSDTVEIEVIDNVSYLEIQNAVNSTIDLGETTYFENLYYFLQISNIGDRTIRIFDARLKNGIAFSIPQSQFPFELLPDETKDLTICYSPTLLGMQTDTLVIEDICQSIELKLIGVCNKDIRAGNSRCDVPITITTKELPEKWLFSSEPIPNPAKEVFKIEYIAIGRENQDVELDAQLFGVLRESRINIENKIITDQNQNGKRIISGELVFHSAALSKGIYLIRIKAFGIVNIRKLIKAE
jgi:hypothetical protein